MTTQATTIRQSMGGVRARIGATVCTVAVLAGALLWQVRSGGDVAPPATSAAVSTSREGAPLRGGLAERYQDQARAAAAEREARVPTMGGMAELYAAQQAEATVIADLESRMGGMAEVYRAQARASTRLYLVGSQDEAIFMRRALAQDGPLHGAPDEQLVRRTVVVVDTEMDVEGLVRLAHATPTELGLPGTHVFDLRPAPAARGRAFAPSGTGIVFDFPHFQ